MTTVSRHMAWLPFAAVPLVAWSKDLTVVALVLPVITALSSAASRREIAVLPSLRSAPPGLTLALMAWAAMTLAWAPDGAALDWIKTVIVLGLGWCVAGVVTAASARAVVAATFGLLIILATERVSGGSLIGLVRGSDPVMRRFDVLSAGLAFLCCLTFPAASILARRSRGQAIGLVAMVGIVAMSYFMDAAPVALVAGLAAFGLVTWLGRRGFSVVVFAILVVAILWGPAVTLAWEHGWSSRLTAIFGPNWGLRLDIWHRVDALIWNEPWLGRGFASGKIIGRDGSDVPFMHPHNGVLQLWLELGLFGVAMFTALMQACARRVATLQQLPMIAATLAVIAIFWLVSFNLWASWWLAAQALTISAAVASVKAATASPQAPVAMGEV